jgi:hypothetical protein
MQRVGGVGWPLDARNGTEIFVDGPEFMICHILKNRPRHDLENFAVEWSGQAVCGTVAEQDGKRVISGSNPRDCADCVPGETENFLGAIRGQQEFLSILFNTLEGRAAPQNSFVSIQLADSNPIGSTI